MLSDCLAELSDKPVSKLSGGLTHRSASDRSFWGSTKPLFELRDGYT